MPPWNEREEKCGVLIYLLVTDEKRALKIRMYTLKDEFAEDRGNGGQDEATADETCQRCWIRVSIAFSWNARQIGRAI